MKKFIFVILAVMMVLGIVASNSSAAILQSPDARLKMEVFTNDGVATVITNANRILGYKLTGTAANTAGLYDTTALGTATASTLFDEAGIDAEGANDIVWYPAPKSLTNGLTIVTSATTCVLTVYYE